MFATIQIDLTQIGRLMRENPDLVRKVNFKDGQHQLLNITVGDKREPDAHGNNLNVSCRPKGAPYDNKWYVGDGKTWEQTGQQVAPSSAKPAPEQSEVDPLPF